MRRRSFLLFLGVACPAVGVAGVSFAGVGQAQPLQAAQQSISERDREFLTVINFANLWEVPMGDLAAERGDSQRVREVAAAIAADHRKLDTAVNDLADQFGVTLTRTPSSTTAKWMEEIRASSGAAFDRVFIDRLRAAHGTVFGLIAEIRAGTRNSTIRDFATQANTIVMKHMTLLESTGLVPADHGFSEASARTMDTPENALSGGDIMLGGVVAAVAGAATIGVVRTFSAPKTAE
jgi:putative membrane protein